MQPKNEVVFEGNVGNTFTTVYSGTANMRQATGLGNYATTLIVIKNTNLSGSDKNLIYGVRATPLRTESTVDWVVLTSGQTLTYGSVKPHINRDPWDAMVVDIMNTASGDQAQAKVYINRKPRGA